jgi:hypothetical protein
MHVAHESNPRSGIGLLNQLGMMDLSCCRSGRQSQAFLRDCRGSVTVDKVALGTSATLPFNHKQRCLHLLSGKHQGTQCHCIKTKLTPWPESASELYHQSDRSLSAKLVPTFCDRGCLAVRATDTYGRILYFLDRSRYVFFQVSPQLYSRGLEDPVPDPLLLKKSGSTGNRTRTSGSVARNSDPLEVHPRVTCFRTLKCITLSCNTCL